MKMTVEELNSIEKEAAGYKELLYEAGLSSVDYDEDAAWSCVQQTYLDFECALKEYGLEIKNCRAWLFSVLGVNIKKYMKKKISDRERIVSLEEFYGTVEKIADLSAPFEEFENIDRKRLYIKKAEELSGKSKDLYLKHYIQGLSLVEIAEETGETLACIKKRNQRMKPQLINLLSDLIPALSRKGEK